MKIPRMPESRVQDASLPGVGFNVRGADFGQENIQQYEKGVQGMIEAAADITVMEKNKALKREKEAEELAIKSQREADEAVQLEAGTRLAQFELTQNQRIRETRGENAMGLDKAYQDDYTKLQNDMVSLTKNARQKAMVGRLMLSTDSQVRNNISAHMAKEMDAVYENKSMAMIETDRTAAIDSMNPERIAESIGKQKAIVEQLGVKNGLSAEEINIEQMEVEKDTKISYIQRVAETDPDTARKILEEDNVLLGDDAIKMEGYIARRERQIKYTQKNAQIDNDILFMTDWASGKITDVNALLKSDKAGITPELAKAVVAYQTDPELITVEDTPGFTVYADKIFDTHDKGAISALLAETISGGSDGKPNMKEISSLVKIAAIRAQGLTLAEFDQNLRDSKRVVKKKGYVDNIIEAVRSWSDAYARSKFPKEVLKSSIYKDLVDEVSSNPPKTVDDAQKSVAKVIEKAQAATNPNRTKYTVWTSDKPVTYKFSKGIMKCTGYDDNGDPIFEETK